MTTTSAELPNLLSVEELSAYLGIPKPTIYVWRTRGIGPLGIKVGRHVRFRQADVEAWLEERTLRSDAPTQSESPAVRAQGSRDKDFDGSGYH